MKKHIPNLLTCMNLATGAIGCIAILEGSGEQAIYYVLVAGLFDFFDGFSARLLKVSSTIGKELDSLADMVSFGLLPALYILDQIAQSNPPNANYRYLAISIAVFSAIRLAKFNVDTRQSDQFIGLPTPANAILVTSLVFLPWSIDDWYIWVSLVALLSFLLVANIPMIALKFKGFGWKGNELRFLLLIVLILVLAFLGLSALPLLIPIYIVFSVVGNLAYRSTV